MLEQPFILSLWKGRIPVRPTMAGIVARVSEEYGVEVEVIKSRVRYREVVIPRQEAMARMVEAGLWTYPQIGRFFNRDHSTVILGVRQALKRRQMEIAA